jgi:long-chain acyl-CoA synthetase
MIYELLETQARSLGRKTAIFGAGRDLTYEQLHREASTVASYLDSSGLRPGNPIVIGIPPSPEFFTAFYGACALGLLVLPVLPSGNLSTVYETVGPVAAIGGENFLAAAGARCPTLKHKILWDRQQGLVVPNVVPTFLRSRLFRNENVMGVSSSGTTGEPRLYLRPAELVVARARLRAQVQGVGQDDVFLASRPFNSGSAINAHVILPLLVGGQIVVLESFERFRAAQAIADKHVTVLYAVPFIFEMLLSIPEEHPVDFSSLRTCISGSAPLSGVIARRFYERFGLHIRQRYSGSHLYPAFAYNLDGPPDSVGRLDGYFPMAILDEAGGRLGPDCIGEIAFSIQPLPPDLRKIAERNPNRRDDFILTGDLGRYDAVGNVYVMGRKSPFIKVGGNRVEPAEVESVLRSHPRVKEALVYGAPLTQGDEMVAATVVPEGELSRAELLRYCTARLDGYKCPTKIEFRDALPRSVHGKIIRPADVARTN